MSGWRSWRFKCPTLHIDQDDSLKLLTDSPALIWLLLGGCSNVRPCVDWRSSFSNPICFCWCRVLTHVPSCRTLAYPMWRNIAGWHVLCPSRSCMLRLDLLAVSVFPVKLTLASLTSIHTVSCEVRSPSWSLFFELFPGSRYLCVGIGDQACIAYYK